jgi:hypothetical protein
MDLCRRFELGDDGIDLQFSLSPLYKNVKTDMEQTENDETNERIMDFHLFR